jgi:predicted ArsR family transcriptional regulator
VADARSSSTGLPVQVASYFRHYSWFAELLINSLREEQGTEALRERLECMGKAVGQQVATRLAGVKDKGARIRALAGIMRELGHQSGSIDPAKEKLPAIEAINCVFHSLAQSYPEVRHFDLAMMFEVVGCDVIHDECMVRGGNVRRFKFNQRAWQKRKSSTSSAPAKASRKRRWSRTPDILCYG